MDKSQIEEVKQEATILSSLNSEYIVKYYESFVEGINLNIIMEFCDGGDLSKFLDLQKLKKKYILEDKIWRYFVQICLGKENFTLGLAFILGRIVASCRVPGLRAFCWVVGPWLHACSSCADFLHL